jgi:ribosomal protein L34
MSERLVAPGGARGTDNSYSYLFDEKVDALVSIMKHFHELGWAVHVVKYDDGEWHLCEELPGKRLHRIDLGVFDNAAQKALHEVGFIRYFYHKDVGMPSGLSKAEREAWVDEYTEKYVWVDRPVRTFYPSKGLIKHFYRYGYKIRVRTKRGKKYLYAFIFRPNVGWVKLNLGLKPEKKQNM